MKRNSQTRSNKGFSKLATFIHVFRNSFFPRVEYYQKLRKVRFIFSFKYFLALIFLSNAILLSIFLTKTIIFADLRQTRQSITESLDSFPSDLTITIKNNQLMTTYDRPYIMYFKYNDVPHALLAIDEFASPDKIDSYNTLVLLTRNGIALRQRDGELRFYTYKQKGPVSFSKENIVEIKNTVSKIFNLLPIFLILVLILVVPFISIAMLVSRFLYLAIISFFIFLFCKLMMKDAVFKKVFQISLHATTAPFILELLLLALGLSLNIPFWFLLLNVIFIAGGVYEAYLDKTTLG